MYLAGNDVIHVWANIIHANSSTGVNIHQVAPVSIENNSITCNAGSGMIIAASGQVSRKKFKINFFYENLIKKQVDVKPGGQPEQAGCGE